MNHQHGPLNPPRFRSIRPRARSDKRQTPMPQPTPRTWPTVLLRHAAPAGSHYDWLLGDPRMGHDPEARLWTARTTRPSWDWPTLESWGLIPLAPHRTRYLRYQGLLDRAPGAEASRRPTKSPSRGWVARVDEGWFIPILWTASRAVIDLQFHGARGEVELIRVGPALWRARWCLVG